MGVVLHIKRQGVRALQSVDIDTTKLPPQLRLLIKRVGFAATISLVEERGGRPVYVPQKAGPDHWLADVIGMEAFEALVEHYGDTHLTMNTSQSLLRQARYQQVLAMLERNVPTNEVSRVTGYCVRSVQKIKAGAVPTELQGDLFEGFAEEVKHEHR